MDSEHFKQEEIELIKGYKETYGFFSTFGCVYWNFGVFGDKYKKFVSFYFTYGSICIALFTVIFTYSTYFSIIYKDIGGIADSGNICILCYGLCSTLINGICHKRDFDYFYGVVGKGYYTYQGEMPRAEVEEKFKNDAENGLKKIFRPFAGTTAGITLYWTIVQPIVHYANGREVDLSRTKLMYPPMEVYFPFNPHTWTGYIVGIILCSQISAVLCPLIWGMDFVYISIVSSLTTQFKILNDSIMNIPKRAKDRFVDKYGQPDETMDIYEDIRFQDCIHDSLVENIKHHQIILRTKQVISSYLSYTFLIVILNNTLLLATNGIIMVDAQIDLFFFKYLAMTLAEVAHGFFFCRYGQELTSESSKLFHCLYSIPWHKYNLKVRKVQNIFMTNTLNPAVEHAAIFNVPASMETFNTILSSAYTYINMLRNL